MATTATLTINNASTNVTVSTGGRGPSGASTQAQITAAITDDAQFRSDIGAAATVHTHTVDAITPIASGKLVGRHGGGSGAGQEIGLDGGLEFQGGNIRREALTGDVTASAGSNATTIANNVVTNAKLAHMATSTIKGRTTAGTGDPEDLSASQARTVLGLGTAALSNTGAFATSAQGLAAIGTPLRVACVGTSITEQGSLLVTDSNPRIIDAGNGHAGWLEHLSNHRARLVRRNGVAETATDKTFGYSGYGLVGLTDGASAVFPLDNAIASDAEVLVLEGGTNDISGGVQATIVSRITNYWTKAVASGKRVIALNVLPYGGQATSAGSMVNGETYEIYTPGTTTWTSFGAADNNTGTVFVKSGGTATGTGLALSKSSATANTNKNLITAVNADIVAVAASLGVTLIDTHSVATLSSGFATTESTWDGIHPTPAYAHRLAKLIDTQLATFYANRPQEMIVPAAGSGVWITSSNSPSGASIPSGWAKSGTFTDTYTAVSDTTGTWQRIRMLQTGTAHSVNALYVRATTGFSAGERVRYACRIRPTSGATFTSRSIELWGRSTTDYSTWRYFDGIRAGSNLGTGDFDPVTGLYISPVFTIPASTVALDAYIQSYNTDVTFEVRQFGIFKVVENL